MNECVCIHAFDWWVSRQIGPNETGVCLCDIHRLALRDKGSGALHLLQGVPCLPAGGCSRRTEGGLCTPPCNLLHSHTQTRTPPCSILLCHKMGGGVTGTLCSSKPRLMHNLCTSSNFNILQGVLKKSQISKLSSTTAYALIPLIYVFFFFRSE